MNTPQSTKSTPRVFISSTVEDLKDYRDAVRDAALRADFFPVMQEYFAATGGPPLPECMRKVDQCDVLVVIVAYRYGWIPKDQKKGQRKSITWLECEQALSDGKKVLAFLVDPKYKWPEDKKEEYRIAQAASEGTATTELLAEVQEAIKNLKAFKNWLDSLGTRVQFTTPDNLTAKVIQSLNEWREPEGNQGPAPFKRERDDPEPYLQWLHSKCAYIDIRGLEVGTGKAHKFGIEELYIPLTTTMDITEDKERKGSREMVEHGRRVELHQALKKKHVTIIGDPGAGKTTFLQRIAFILCQSLLNIEPDAAKERLGLQQIPLPLFIRLGELAEHIRSCCEQKAKEKPTLETDPTWLAHFLVERSYVNNWGLSQGFFVDQFRSGNAMFLLDGLDEAPDRRTREKLSELVAEASNAYSQCSFVVTSRPKAYTERTVLQDYHRVQIEPLEKPAMESFLWHWSLALFHQNEAEAKAHHEELKEALASRLEIRKMARSPVMLTALTVVHWNERRLPEQRVDLYESIIIWLLRSREKRPGRMSVDECELPLQNLALKMQCHAQGRQVQVDRGWAVEAIQDDFPGKTKEKRVAAAERFLTEEEVDSGVVVGRSSQVAFWHLTFQEYLAAKALGGKGEEEQKSLLLRPKILYDSEWREVLLLFGGVLRRQGVGKVDGFFRAILDKAMEKKKLTDEARFVGLIGAMLRDLVAFKYELTDLLYAEMLDRVMAIFDRDKAKTIPLEVRLEAADALGQAGDPRLEADPVIDIPGGRFWMGAQKRDTKARNFDPDAVEDEFPVHEVELSSFAISKYPITVGQYRRFIEDGGYEEERYWEAGGFGEFKEPDKWEEQLQYPSRPVVYVSWYEAAAYACWAGGRLPTEAEWERAARGPDEEYRKYPWGNNKPTGETANFSESNVGHITPVGVFPEDCSPEVVIDLAGNVWEWCWDWYGSEYYKSCEQQGVVKDPRGPKKGADRVVRGGSFFYRRSDLRCGDRSRDGPRDRVSFGGFRVVRGV